MAKRQEFSFLAYCAASGLCGALSAACCKEAGRPAASPYIAAAMYTAMLAVRSSSSIISSSTTLSFLSYNSPSISDLPQFNFLGLTLFSLALRRTASLQATAASVSANILASGIVGCIFYSETLHIRWWLGLTCLTIGTVLVQPQLQAKIEEIESQRGRQRHRRQR